MSMAEVIDIDDARASQQRDNAEACLPPHDLIAEETVLADLFLGGASHLALVKDFLRDEHFYSEGNRRIYEAMLAVDSSGEPIDTTTVMSLLRQWNRVSQVGGWERVTMLLDSSAPVSNIVPHARIIHDRWRERQTVHAAERIAAAGRLGIDDTQAYVDDAVRTLSDIARASVTARVESNVDAIKRILASISERSSAKSKVPLGIPTGIGGYDEEWGGLHGSEVTTVVARPGVGKTSLAIQMLARVTARGLGVLLFSQDSPRDDLLTDLISHVAMVDSRRFRKGELDTAEWGRITAASSEIGQRRFWIDDSRKIHVGQVRARAISTADDAIRKDRVPLGLVIVDYVQQLSPAPEMLGRKKHEYVGHAASEIKTLARSLRVPILELAQQKRDYNGKPVFEAADSSEIEKECDNLFFLERTSSTTRRLRCEKVRRGARMNLDLAFDGSTRTFSDARLEAESRKYVDRGGRGTSPAARAAESDSVWGDDDGSIGGLVGGGS